MINRVCKFERETFSANADKKRNSRTIDELITGESTKMVFKSMNELAPQYLCDLFTRKSACLSYRLSNTRTNLRLPMKRSSNGKKYFSYRGPKLWNSLGQSMQPL